MTGYYEMSLERDVARIKAKIATMGALAERAVAGAVRALVERNRQLAYSVILRDERIDELEKEIDRLCLEFILRQQPVGRHLRFAFATIKVNSQLERVGDYAESIARQTLAICSQRCEVPAEPFEAMVGIAVPMLHSAVSAFVEQDIAQAEPVPAQEDRVDALRDAFSGQLVRWREEGKIPLQAFGPLLNVGNRLERVADQARSIAQNASYVSTGDYQKHRGADVYRVLFIDDRNACRSVMAEAIGNAMEQPRFVFASAGVDPAGAIDGATVFFLQQRGIGSVSHPPQKPEKVPNFEHFQVLVALSQDARRVFPPPPSRTICLEWFLPDATKVDGTAEEIEAALEQAYAFLRDHIRDLVEALLGSSETPTE